MGVPERYMKPSRHHGNAAHEARALVRDLGVEVNPFAEEFAFVTKDSNGVVAVCLSLPVLRMVADRDWKQRGESWL